MDLKYGKSEESNMSQLINSTFHLKFGNIDKYNQLKSLLTGVVEYVYFQDDTRYITRALGVLVKPNVLITTMRDIDPKILNIPLLKIRFFSNDPNNMNSLANIIDYRFLDDVPIGILILDSMIGDLILAMDQREETYFTLESIYSDSKSKLNILAYNNWSFESEITDTINIAISNSSIVIDQIKDKMYVILQTNNENKKLLEAENFIYLHGYKLTAIISEMKNLTLERLKTILEAEIFEKILTKCRKFSDYIILEYLLFKPQTINSIRKHIDTIRRKHLNEDGIISFPYISYLNIKDYFQQTDIVFSIINGNLKYFFQILKKLNVNTDNIDHKLLIKKLLTQNINIIERVHFKNINSDIFPLVLESFYFSKFINSIDLSSNVIDEFNCLNLSDFLIFNKNYKYIILCLLRIAVRDLQILLKAIAENRNLVSINISQNDFSNDTYYEKEILTVFARILKIKSLKEFYFYDNKLTIKNFSKIFSFLNDSLSNTKSNIQILNLSRTNLDLESIKILTNFLNRLDNLTHLYLQNCNINDGMAKYLFENLKYFNGLVLLDLANNLLTEKACLKLQNYISNLFPNIDNSREDIMIINTKNIEFTLILNNNPIKSEGVVTICEGINNEKIIYKLFLNNTRLTTMGLEAIHNKIITGIYIETLSIANNSISNRVISECGLNEVLNYYNNRDLEFNLYLHSNLLNLESIYLLIKDLTSNGKIKILCDKFKKEEFRINKNDKFSKNNGNSISFENKNFNDYSLMKDVEQEDKLDEQKRVFSFIEFYKK